MNTFILTGGLHIRFGNQSVWGVNRQPSFIPCARNQQTLTNSAMFAGSTQSPVALWGLGDEVLWNSACPVEHVDGLP